MILRQSDYPAVKKTTPPSEAKLATTSANRENPKSPNRQARKSVHNISQVDATATQFEITFLNELERDVDMVEPTRNKNIDATGDARKRIATISRDEALTLSCELMAVAIQFRQWLSLQTASNATLNALEDKLGNLLDRIDDRLNLSARDGTLLDRLNALLDTVRQGTLQVQPDSATGADSSALSILSDAIHATITAMSHQESIHAAIERASRRSIYQFAYGLTHEINNPLANIAARAQQLISTVASETDKRSLATIVDQAMRAHEMLSEMMRVVQPRVMKLQSDDVVSVVRQTVQDQLMAWTHAKIHCELRLSPTPLFGAVERASLSEAIASVLQNALQVCRPTDCIEVICAEVAQGSPLYGPEDDSLDGSQQAYSDASRIRIAIRDTGPGMSSETAARAWDLYFSGREHGRGLGISLANVRRILDAHHGLVWIESAPNSGCVVEIRLPRVASPTHNRRSISI
jgi:signal transduction histidine kinase